MPRTQDITPVMIETSGFYIFTKSLINEGRRIGDNPYIEELDYVQSIDIDNKEDYDLAVSLWERYH